METGRSGVRSQLIVTAALGLILSSCSPGRTPAPASPAATTSPTQTPVSSPAAIPSPTAAPTATPVPPPEVTLNPGDAYLSVDGTQRFVFLRNVAGFNPDDYTRELDLAQQADTLAVRVGTDNSAMSGPYGFGYTSAGDIVESWSASWEAFFDAAGARGIYVIPFFAGWSNWNTAQHGGAWEHNPLNSANGDPAKDPSEFYRKDSPTQKLYVNWFKNVVTRWQKHKNILAWEVITEVNNINGIDEADCVYLFDQLAQVAREGDPEQRPVMASLADIGESGLNALPPDNAQGSGELPNAQIGMEHAIWSETVSGVMDGRALFWEDAYGIYFSSLGWPYLLRNTDLERPVAQFGATTDPVARTPPPSRSDGNLARTPARKESGTRVPALCGVRDR